MYGHFAFMDSWFSLPFFGLFLAVLLLWTLVIKGFALWRAARNSQKGWYIALLIINSAGILEVIYLIWFSKKEVAAAPSSAPAAP